MPYTLFNCFSETAKRPADCVVEDLTAQIEMATAKSGPATATAFPMHPT